MDMSVIYRSIAAVVVVIDTDPRHLSTILITARVDQSIFAIVLCCKGVPDF